jgi:SSS family solute:Na+ symporter
MDTYFTGLDWLVLASYFAGTMAIGFYCYRRSRSIEGFTAASRSLPGWLVGLSIFGTYLSSISFLALPGKAFATNWNPFVFSLSLPLSLWIAVRWFLPFYRASGEVSAYAHLEHRFGPWARVYGSICFLLTQIARIGAVTYLMALPLAVLAGWDIRLVILVISASVTVYSAAGGLLGAIWTDAFQTVVLFAGMIGCILIVLAGMPAGPGQVFTIAAEHAKFSLGSFGPSLAEATVWVVLIYGLFTNLQNFGIDQSYIQRYVASSTDHEARQSLWLGGLLYVPVSAGLFFIGTALYAWYHAHPDDLANLRHAVAAEKLAQLGGASTPSDTGRLEQLASQLTDEDLGDKAFPYFIGTQLPSGMAGLVLAAVLAAGMGNISTSVNSSATLLLCDFYQRYLNPHATERQSMLVLYAGSLLWGVLGTGVALLMVNTKSALDVWWLLASIFSGGIVGLFLLGLIARRADNPTAVTAVILGVLVILWMTVSTTAYWPSSLAALRSPFHGFLVIVIGTLTILLVGLVLSRLRVATKQADSDSFKTPR